jgi:plastocyanin domain-containing protein
MSIMQLAVLITGLALIGGIIWYFFLTRPQAADALVTDGIQETLVTVKGGYAPAEIRVRAGQPVRLIFDRQETNPCSEELVIPDFRIREFLAPNRRTAVEFTPTAPGTYQFSCGMGMLRGKVVVQ